MANGADSEIIVFGDKLGEVGHALDYYLNLDHPSAREKEMFGDCAEILGLGGVVFSGGGSLIGLAPPLWGPAAYAISLGILMGVTALGFQHLANDPPQPDYMRPVRVDRLAIYPPGTFGADTPGALPLLDTFNDLIPSERGMLDAYERAQGAKAARNQRWRLAHGRGARLLQSCATTRLLQLPSRLEQLRSEHLDALVLRNSDYLSLQQKARTHNLITEPAQAVLLSGGLTLEDLRAVEDSIARRATDTLPTGNFKSLVTDLAASLRTAATNLSLA